MEDVTAVQFERAKGDKKVVEYAAFAIFDGHGGKEAAHFARDHILENIKNQKGFFSKDVETVKKAISDGFISTHQQMWHELPSWPKTSNGHPSTAGTTASLVLIRGNKMYVANVGDSMVVMGTRDYCYRNNPRGFQAMELTVDHKPELPEERKRIERCGGCVMNKAGVNRVVWNRPKLSHNGPIRRSTKLDKIPFLAIARSLGDLWSYNSEVDEFIVSPVPDVHAYDLHHEREQFIVLASDGLWNMVRPYESVTSVGTFDERKQKKLVAGTPAHELVQLALDRWKMRAMRADNTSVIVVYIERKKMDANAKKRDTYSESWTSARLDGSKKRTDEIGQPNLFEDVNKGSEPGASSSPPTPRLEPTPDLSVGTSGIPPAKPDVTEPLAGVVPNPTPPSSVSSKGTEPLQDSSISSSSGDVVDDTGSEHVFKPIPRLVRSDCNESIENLARPSVSQENFGSHEADEPSSSNAADDLQKSGLADDSVPVRRITRKISRDLETATRRTTRSSTHAASSEQDKKGQKRRKSEEPPSMSAKSRKVGVSVTEKSTRTNVQEKISPAPKKSLMGAIRKRPSSLGRKKRSHSPKKGAKNNTLVTRRRSDPVMSSKRSNRVQRTKSPAKRSK